MDRTRTAPADEVQLAALGELQQAMGDIVRQIPRLRQRVVREAGLSLDGASTSILARLRQDGPLPLTGLAERVHLDLSFVSRKVRMLEQHGFVHRTPYPDDGRVAILRLTTSGELAVRQLSDAWRSVLATLLAEWDPGEVEQFQRLSRRYADALQSFDLNEPPLP